MLRCLVGDEDKDKAHSAVTCNHLPREHSTLLLYKPKSGCAGQQNHFGAEGSLICVDTRNPKQNHREPRKTRTAHSLDSGWAGPVFLRFSLPGACPLAPGTETRPGSPSYCLISWISPWDTCPRDRPSPFPATATATAMGASMPGGAHQLLEEISHTLLVAPLLHSGEQPIVELLVDLIELRHFEEDGLDLLARQHRLRRGGGCFQRLHRLKDSTGQVTRWSGRAGRP